MFNTGDLCKWKEDGTLEHLGRNDDQVKIKVCDETLEVASVCVNATKGFRVELDGVSAVIEVRYPDGAIPRLLSPYRANVYLTVAS